MITALYPPLNLSSSSLEIRLLELEKGYLSDKIVCHLITTEIGNVHFEALSYVWGQTEDPLPTIEVNGHDVQITNNLESALQDLRSPYRSRILWVDAICINQKDPLEQNHQVKSMRLIYERAYRVVVWLDSSCNHKVANEDAKLLLSALTDENAHWFPIKGMQSTIDKTLQSIMMKVVESSWWRRVWTAQEAAVAKELIFMHGRSELPGEFFGQLLANIVRHLDFGCCFIRIYDNISLSLYLPELDPSFQGVVSKMINVYNHPQVYSNGTSVIRRRLDPFFSPDKPFLTNASFLQDICNLEILRKGRRSSFLELAAICRERSASNPSDRVYALLGLAQELEEFVIDYRLPVSEVYERLTIELIRKRGDFDIFSHILTPIPKLPADAEIEKMNTVSWVPDWSYNHIFVYPRFDVMRYRNHFTQTFNAGGNRSPNIERMSPGKLKISGIALDSVQKLSVWITAGYGFFPPPALILEQITKWRRTAGLQHAKKPYIGGGIRQDAFWRSLCLDSRLNDGLPLIMRAGEFDRVIHETWWPLVTNSEASKNREPCDCGWLGCGFDPGGSLTGKMRIFHEHVLKCVTDRRFAVSENGYFCLLPCSTKKGDRIFIFPGGKVPFILRPVEKTEPGEDESELKFTLVGDAYVHGVMDGQVWGLVEKGQAKLHSVVLV
jgi:hypothetical protein